MPREAAQDPTVISTSEGIRILCVAEARGALRRLNELAASYAADVIVHTGSFGFFDGDSSASMSYHMLASAATFSSVVRAQNFRALGDTELREAVGSQLSELPLFLAGAQSFDVPVYTIWGSSEDVRVIEKFHDGSYSVPNLHIVDEKTAPLIPGTSVRLVGLPGAFLTSHLYDSGDGTNTVAGTTGLTWASIWQIGELIHTVRKSFVSSEVRLFVSHAAPAQHALLHYLALLLRADFTVSGSLHYRFTSSFSDMATDTDSHHFERKLDVARANFQKQWNQVEAQVLEATAETPKQRDLITSTVELLVTPAKGAALQYIKQAHRNLWHFNLCDMDSGVLVLRVSSTGVIGATSESKGFDFALRNSKKVSTDSNNDHEESGDDDTKRDQDQKKKRKEKLRKEKDDKKEKRKNSDQEAEPVHPGLWFKNGNRPTEEILGFLDEADRTAARVDFRSNTRADGTKTRVALVYFDTQEQASQAYDRVDKDAAGTVSILQPQQHQRHSHRKYKGRSSSKW